MRKFEVEITRVNKFIVSIDEDKLDKDFIPEFEEFIHKLEGDKIQSLSEYLGYKALEDDGTFNSHEKTECFEPFNMVHYEPVNGLFTESKCPGEVTIKSIEIK